MKRKLFGIAGGLAVVLALGLVLAGCPTDGDDTPSGYTFKFTIKNAPRDGAATVTITKIEFLNGMAPDSPVLETKNVSLAPGAASEQYTVSGFTNAWMGDMYSWGICLYWDGGSKWGYGNSNDGGEFTVELWDADSIDVRTN